jgi:hypothetical protein
LAHTDTRRRRRRKMRRRRRRRRRGRIFSVGGHRVPLPCTVRGPPEPVQAHVPAYLYGVHDPEEPATWREPGLLDNVASEVRVEGGRRLARKALVESDQLDHRLVRS